VRKDDLLDLQISLPELPEQQRIAERLEQADRLVRTRRYALELIDTLIPAAFIRFFGETGDRFPVPTVDELAADKPNAIRTGPFGSQLLHSEFTDRGIAILGIDNAVNNEFAWSQRRFITPEKYEQLKRYTGVSRRRDHHHYGHLWSMRDRPRRHSDGDQHETSVLHHTRPKSLSTDLPPRGISVSSLRPPSTKRGDEGFHYGRPQHADYQESANSIAPAPPPAELRGPRGASGAHACGAAGGVASGRAPLRLAPRPRLQRVTDQPLELG